MFIDLGIVPKISVILSKSLSLRNILSWQLITLWGVLPYPILNKKESQKRSQSQLQESMLLTFHIRILILGKNVSFSFSLVLLSLCCILPKGNSRKDPTCQLQVAKWISLSKYQITVQEPEKPLLDMALSQCPCCLVLSSLYKLDSFRKGNLTWVTAHTRLADGYVSGAFSLLLIGFLEGTALSGQCLPREVGHGCVGKGAEKAM